jgi:hypothetical protein
MNEADKLWYEGQLDLFSTQGYKDFVSQATTMKEALDTLYGVDTVEKLHNHKGQLEILNWITGWQTAVESSYKELSNENAA